MHIFLSDITESFQGTSFSQFGQKTLTDRKRPGKKTQHHKRHNKYILLGSQVYKHVLFLRPGTSL